MDKIGKKYTAEYKIFAVWKNKFDCPLSDNRDVLHKHLVIKDNADQHFFLRMRVKELWFFQQKASLFVVVKRYAD